MKFLFIAFIALSLMVTNCGSPNKNSEAAQKALAEERWEEMMALHDNVMPKMSEINKISRELKKMENIPAELKAEVQDMLTTLDKADEGMMSWMAGFSKYNSNTYSHEDLMKAYDQEMEAGKAVEQTILSSIEKGNELLKKLKGE
jgi:hypothetical protein